MRKNPFLTSCADRLFAFRQTRGLTGQLPVNYIFREFHMKIKDLARIAGVSPSTVSKIMHQKDDNISAETREHVLSIAKQYNYVPRCEDNDPGGDLKVLKKSGPFSLGNFRSRQPCRIFCDGL